MSELTSCNYCTLLGIKERAKQNKEKVRVVPNAKWGGVDVKVDGRQSAWFMELTKHCCC